MRAILKAVAVLRAMFWLQLACKPGRMFQDIDLPDVYYAEIETPIAAAPTRYSGSAAIAFLSAERTSRIYASRLSARFSTHQAPRRWTRNSSA
jgi:hypothetical protein